MPVGVQYAGLNYKDALAATGKGKTLRRYPCIGGINADTRPPLRTRLWQRLASDLKPRFINDLLNIIDIKQLPEVMDEMIAGRTRGRTLIRFHQD